MGQRWLDPNGDDDEVQAERVDDPRDGGAHGVADSLPHQLSKFAAGFHHRQCAAEHILESLKRLL
ncbi:hypothetical protein GCM10027022_09520 [Alpinimonas psychrophila]